MELSGTMGFVMKRAAMEAAAAHKENEQLVEFIFLGLLKLAESTADQTSAGGARAMEHIKATADVLHNAGIDTQRTRSLLRAAIRHGAPLSSLEESNACLRRAEEHARQDGARTIAPEHMAQAVLEEPTAAILQVCPVEKTARKFREKTGDGTSPDNDGGHENEMSRTFLPELTRRIRHMRATLLSTVHGQDHVVHAFSEGMFAAEVLAASDEKRRRPRAIFVFAGPPGVGKTFLAEQAAEALAIPFKRFDMSSYADHQSYMGLVGFEPSYKDAKPGTLTGFVKESPHCILLFDEVEKAHLNTVQLFLQILDAGRLSDRFLDEDISFKDAIIIFTTNACRSLYEGDRKQNAAGVPRRTVLSALETEKDPRTGQPFFPAAITSRMATGWPLLFNHLQAHHLEKISAGELDRMAGLLRKQYGIETETDRLLPTALLFQEGGQTDARTLRAQTELFVKNELFKVCRLWGEDNSTAALAGIDSLRFTIEADSLSGETAPLFFSDEKPEILLYCDPVLAARFHEQLPGYVIYDTQNVDEALKLAGEKDIRLCLLDAAEPSRDFLPAEPAATVFESEGGLMMSQGAFDYAPMAAGALRDGSRLFRSLRERLPDLPIYLLETESFPIDPELLASFVRAGARGKLESPKGDFSIMEDELSAICRDLYLQGTAARLAAERRALYFETAPRLSEDGREIAVRLRSFSLKRTTSADDAGSVLDDVEKPNIRFSDVVGAGDAKEELQFFIDYLKNPKRFTAQGLKPPKGVLLYGPPGTGKTMLAKAMAGESSVAFIPAAASTFVTKYQGSGPESVRELFQKARRYAPSILFIDEIDAVGRKRGQSNTAHGEEMALNALLTEMDGFSVDPRRPVFVLAATNFDVEEGQGGLGVIDAALARRFDRKILVDLPNEKERELFIRLTLQKDSSHVVTEDMIRRFASRSTGMSPANLASVLELAGRMAVKAQHPLDDAILDEAFEITRHGEKKDWGRDYLERVARHESGHAFLCWLGGNTPSYLTIVARGGHGGYMEHSSADMGPLQTRDELLNRIRTSLGGRAAELAYYGEKDGISTGASGDLENATRIAQAMICNYGMDEKFGLAVLGREAASNPDVRCRVNELLREEMNRTVEIIRKNKPRIDRLVDALLEKNKLNGPEIEELLKEEASS